MFKGKDSVRVPGRGRGVLQIPDFDSIVILSGNVQSSPDIQIERTLDNRTLLSMFGPGLRPAQFMGISPTCGRGSDLSSLRTKVAKQGMLASLTFDGTSYRGIVTSIVTRGSSDNMEGVVQTEIHMLVETV